MFRSRSNIKTLPIDPGVLDIEDTDTRPTRMRLVVTVPDICGFAARAMHLLPLKIRGGFSPKTGNKTRVMLFLHRLLEKLKQL